MIKNRRLKPCPFCGNDALALQCDNDLAYVSCMKCHADGPIVYLNEYEGGTPEIDAWNDRRGGDN